MRTNFFSRQSLGILRVFNLILKRKVSLARPLSSPNHEPRAVSLMLGSFHPQLRNFFIFHYTSESKRRSTPVSELYSLLLFFLLRRLDSSRQVKDWHRAKAAAEEGTGEEKLTISTE